MPKGIYKRDPIAERFWNKVDIRSKDECWEWQAGINSTGRGMFSIGRKSIKAHRMAWTLTNGEIPENMIVCHKCDNGKCVNPNHLFLGTHKDNVADMYKKGRQNILKGENDPKSKLSKIDVLQIRKLYKSGKYSQQKIADKFCVARTTIQSILDGRNWKHV